MITRYSTKMVASIYGTSESTVRRNLSQMRAAGLWPKAIIRQSGVWVDPEAYDDFLSWKESRRGVNAG